MTLGKKTLDDLKGPGRRLREHIPEVYAGFSHLGKAAMEDGALDTKTKELIAVAVAVATKCDGCMATHTRAAASAGATEPEVAEAIGVAILLAGGPATVYGPRALEAFVEFAGLDDKKASAEGATAEESAD